ncbi:MAG: hypothetical protein N2745_09080 [Syntrophorhabdaceae bacterium]|nr:hypothetical protein [Syntrophorhabdaceae bacterium]
MRELFDINLLSQITGLDRKFAISKEQQGLKRKKVEGEYSKERKNNPPKQIKGIGVEKKREEDREQGERDGEHHLNITV